MFFGLLAQALWIIGAEIILDTSLRVFLHSRCLWFLTTVVVALKTALFVGIAWAGLER